MRRHPSFLVVLLTVAGCRAVIGFEEGEPIAGNAQRDGGDGGSGNASRDSAAESGPCGARSAICGDVCVDLASDASNCGACGTTCSVDAPSTVVCALGRCLATLAAVPGTLSKPQVRAGQVFVTNTVSNALVRVPVRGGPVVSTPVAGIGALVAADGASVYWSAGGALWTATGDGADPRQLTPALGSVLGVSTDGLDLYFASGNTVRRVGVRGGDPEVLATTGTVRSLVGDSTSLYFSDESGDVSVLPRAGGERRKLAWGQSSPGEVAVTTTDVYWVSNGTLVQRVILGGGPWMQVATGTDRLLSDGLNVYGRSSSAGLVKLPASGGPPEVLAARPAVPEALDATSVYWVESASGVGKIMRLMSR